VLIEHITDLDDAFVAEQRLIDLRCGKAETIAPAQLMKRHGLAD
jgi:hypothetical protein